MKAQLFKGSFCFLPVIIMLGSAVFTPLRAQIITLYDAVERAKENYPLIRQRVADVAATRAHIHTVKDQLLPSLQLQEQLNAGTANPLQGSYFPLSIIPSTSGSYTGNNTNVVSDGNIAIAYMQWEFFNFGYFAATKQYAKAQYDVSAAQLESDRYQLTQLVVDVYIDWLQKYRLLQVEQDNMQRSLLQLTAIRATVLSGLKPGVDSTTAAAVYAQSEIDYYKAQENYEADRISIASIIFQDSVYNEQIMPDTATFELDKINSFSGLNWAEGIAEDHPVLQVFNMQYLQQLTQNKMNERRFLPKLDLNGAYWFRNSGISPSGTYPATDIAFGMPYGRVNYLFGLTFSYDLANLQHRHDVVMEDKYLAESKLQAKNLEKLNFERLARQAAAAHTATLNKLTAIPLQLNAAQRAYEQQSALYRAGLNTLIDLTNAQYALRQAATNLVVAKGDLLQVVYLRAALNGQSDTFIQSFKP